MHSRWLPLLSASMLLGALGCAPPGDEEPTSHAGSAVALASVEDEASVFALEYSAGWLVDGRFEEIERSRLDTVLPATVAGYARCLAARRAGSGEVATNRRDLVRGETLEAKEWKVDGATYYVLDVELADSAELRDVSMAFVFSRTGAPRFQLLSWDSRKNVKIVYRQDPPC